MSDPCAALDEFSVWLGGLPDRIRDQPYINQREDIVDYAVGVIEGILAQMVARGLIDVDNDSLVARLAAAEGSLHGDEIRERVSPAPSTGVFVAVEDTGEEPK